MPSMAHIRLPTPPRHPDEPEWIEEEVEDVDMGGLFGDEDDYGGGGCDYGYSTQMVKNEPSPTYFQPTCTNSSSVQIVTPKVSVDVIKPMVAASGFASIWDDDDQSDQINGKVSASDPSKRMANLQMPVQYGTAMGYWNVDAAIQL